MNRQETDAIISQCLRQWRAPDQPYPRQLPPELELWRCYTIDGGHSILVVLKGVYEQDGPPITGSTLPAPVKTVERTGWTVIEGGYLLCDLPYDPALGLIVQPGDDEY